MGEATQVSALPLPSMQYVGLYTDENVQHGLAPSPPRPLHEGYSMFGAPFPGDEPVIHPLESPGIRRLYPQNYEHKKELKKLNHSLLVNFLDMVDILIRCPDISKRLEKKEDMSLLFIHMHHLINEYRPHQARETLRVLLDMQRQQRLDTAHRFQKYLDKVSATMRFVWGSLSMCCFDKYTHKWHAYFLAGPKGPLTCLDTKDELTWCANCAMAVVSARCFTGACHNKFG
ncbi:mediator of RNA polymerase II transcription subunit 7 isoform X2 [Rhipicephalus microplus]